MLILCFLNLFSVLIFFFLHSLHRFCSYSFLSFSFFFFFTVLSLLSFYFSVSQFFLSTSLFLPVCHFCWNDASCCCLYFRCQLYTKKKKKRKEEIFTLTKELISDSHHDVSRRAERGFYSNKTATSRHGFNFIFKLFCFPSFLRRGITAGGRIHHRARRRGKANISSDALSRARVRQLLSD